MARNGCGSVRAFDNVPIEAEPYYWRDGSVRGFYSIVRSLGVDVVNLVSNPSAELNLDGWHSDGGDTLTRSSADSYQNAYGVLVTPVPLGGPMNVGFAALQAVSPFPQIDIPVGETYYGLIAVRACAGDTVTALMTADGIIPPGATFTEGREVYDSDGNWRLIELSMTNTGTVPIATRLFVESNNASGCNEMYVDSAQITAREFSTPFNGDDLFAGWNGAAHASQSTALAERRAAGVEVNLSEYNFDMIGDGGFGFPPVNLITSTYAQRAGASYQNAQVLPRTLTLTGRIEDCNPIEIHCARHQLIKDIGLWDLTECAQEMTLKFQYTDECGNPIGEKIEMQVEYAGGLDGARTDITAQQITMQFVANELPYWHSERQRGFVLANGANIVDYEGTAPTSPKFRFRGPMTLNSITNNSNGGLVSWTGGFVIPAGQYMLLETQPGLIVSVLVDEATGVGTLVGHLIDYTVSQLARFRLSPTGADQNQLTLDAAIGAGGEAVMVWFDNFLSADSALRGCC